MTTVAIYARYSSDNQREASIEDQVRLCRERADTEGWTVTNVYSDHAISGASLIRPGIQQLLRDALAGKFDVILAEALDRLSRDQEDIAGVYKRMQFAGISMITLSEGEITDLHIGLKGTMNAVFLKDLADKTRRGLRGRVEKGKSGGGKSYGYDVVKQIDDKGEYAKGERAINKEQASIVRRIFENYVKGISPRAIAVQLNRDNVPCPSGGEWGASTIYGNRQRGTGILNNELYIGIMVWNRLRYLKDPDTGRRVSRLNPQADWITKGVLELRIIDQELWDQVKKKQGEINRHETALWKKNRPSYLLSHLVKCGCCGGGFSMIGKTSIGCSTARNKGTCDNRLTMKRVELEKAVLGSLSQHLMDERLCVEFCTEYMRRMNELRKEHNASLNGYKAELLKLEKQENEMIQAIMDGFANEELKKRMNAADIRKKELRVLLDGQEEDPVLFHPSIAGRYHKEIRALITSFNKPDARTEAASLLRTLIDRIVLTPTANKQDLTVDLIGDLAGILSIATNREKREIQHDLSKHQPVQEATAISKVSDALSPMFETQGAFVAGIHNHRVYSNLDPAQEALVAGVGNHRLLSDLDPAQEALVAGVGFEPTTFRL